MASVAPETTYCARWLVPVGSPPLEDAWLTVSGTRIAAVGGGRAPARARGQVIDLGNVALLPGLVNPHTHLEFSDLSQPLGQPPICFASWVRQVIEYRTARDARFASAAAQPPPKPHSQNEPARPGPAEAAPLERGLAESARCGTTTLGDIAAQGWDVLAGPPPLDATVFWEFIGVNPGDAEPLAQLADELLRARWPYESLRVGLSPHAPYTVGVDLLERLLGVAAHHDAPVAFHLAESREELELLAVHTGPLVDLLGQRGMWRPEWFTPRLGPLDYLRLLARAPRALVIHGNYLGDEEIAFLAARPQRMAVVYCPRTHARFGHPRHPLPRLLEAGACVAVGTDSRASNPDLSMLAELRFVAQRFPELPLSQVLDLGTLAGARALGADDQAGTLAPGKLANLAVVQLAADSGDPHALVLHGSGPVVATLHRGRWTCGGLIANEAST